MNNHSGISIPDFICIHIDHSEIGLAHYFEGSIVKETKFGISREEINRLLAELNKVQYVVAYNIDSHKSALKRILASYEISLPDKFYGCVRSWNNYSIGEMNLGSACQYFNIPVIDPNFSFWEPAFKAHLAAKLVLNLNGMHQMDLQKRSSRDSDIIAKEKREFGIINQSSLRY